MLIGKTETLEPLKTVKTDEKEDKNIEDARLKAFAKVIKEEE